MESKIVVGIIGAGIVGSATGCIFESLCPDKVKVIYYDKFKPEFQNNFYDVLDFSDFIFLCLPTPMKITGEISLQYVEDSLKEISEYLSRKPDQTFIIRSTSVSGSTDRFQEKFPMLKLAFCPEFLTERNSKEDSLLTNRVVIGANDHNTYKEIEKLFKTAYEQFDDELQEKICPVQFIEMTCKEAEMVKYMSNVFLAAQVMVANEIYFVCRKMGINYDKVRQALLTDRRIGTFTQVPGYDGDFGVGGKCFPKDVNAFIYLAKENGIIPNILEVMMKWNDHIRIKKDWWSIPGATEGCLYGED